MGYEPLGLPIMTDRDVITRAVRAIDTVFVATVRSDGLERVAQLAPALAGKRLLVLTPVQGADTTSDLRWTTTDHSDRRPLPEDLERSGALRV